MGGGNRGKNHMGRAINQLTRNLHIHVINRKVHTMRHINALILNSHITEIIKILCLHMEATFMQQCTLTCPFYIYQKINSVRKKNFSMATLKSWSCDCVKRKASFAS